jgi:hypothetical protein
MKFIMLSMVLLLNIACNKNSVEETKLQSLPQNSPQQTPTSIKKENNLNDFWIYTRVFEKIAYTDVFEKIDNSDSFTIKKETITPEDPDIVKSLPNLSEDLINDFLEKNKTKGILGKKGSLSDQLDVYVGHNIIEQKGSLETFFIAQKKKFRRLKGIIGFSQIGVNSDKSQTLVYVEFYNPEKHLQKKYCLMTWGENNTGALIDKDVKWF